MANENPRNNASDNVSETELRQFRQGLVVYLFALAIIIAIGIYLLQQAQALDNQYNHILNSLL